MLQLSEITLRRGTSVLLEQETLWLEMLSLCKIIFIFFMSVELSFLLSVQTNETREQCLRCSPHCCSIVGLPLIEKG